MQVDSGTGPDGTAQLDGKVVLVTGSARGIGEAVARRFAAAGAAVVVNARSAEGPGVAVAADLPDARFVAGDVSDPEAVARLVGAAIDGWGHLDHVVNCAGVTRPVPLADLDGVTDADWQSCFDVNVMGIWQVSRLAAPHLRAAGGGAIVNVTSAAGIRPAGSSIPYAVSKAAANHLTRLLAKALAPEIRVSAVAPGFVDTPLTASMDPAFRAGYEQTAPLRRIGRPDEIAEACLFLACSTFSTGDVLLVDGGLAIS